MLSRSSLFFTRNAVLGHFRPRSTAASVSPIKNSLRTLFRGPRLPVANSKLNFTRNTSIAANLAKPPVSAKPVAYWLFGTSTLIFGIVVLGGLTRLTESGLSITEWKPVTGAIPPLNEQEWEEEFARYRNLPEFKQLNSHITMDEFKFIFSMEWGHRLVGRAIGMFFILPALWFWKTGRFTRHTTYSVLGLTGLLGLQGAIGWWMVKSGLDEEELKERKSKPTVSQYRLTTHLGAAFAMYLGVCWTGIQILRENKWVNNIGAAAKEFDVLSSPQMKKFKVFGYGLLALAFVTAMSGGMVAGLDAGLIYNTFPHMGDDWVPSNNELMSLVFARKADLSDLWWRNLLENPTTVQLVHRVFATTTFFTVLVGHLWVAKNKAIVPRSAVKAVHGVMGLVSLQVALGISTLIYLVPIPLAAAHQAGALALLTGCLAFLARMAAPRRAVARYVKDMARR